MKSIIIIILFILNTSLFSDVVIAQTFDSDFNKTFIWKISDKVYESLPETDWDNNPNLKLVDAVKKAVAVTKMKYPDKKIIVNRIGIVQPIRVEVRKNVYFYDITIDVHSSDGRKFILTNQVVMFLNGEIIDPA